MTGRQWRSRQIRRGDYELDVDGRIAVFVSFQDPTERPSALIRRILTVVAEHHDDQVAGAPGVDWEALGWADAAEHDALVADLSDLIHRWDHTALGPRCLMYVRAEKLRAGLPATPPYSVAQLDALDRIIRRAPNVVANDLQTEQAQQVIP